MQSLLQTAFINTQCKTESFLTGIASYKNAFMVMNLWGFCVYIFINIIGTSYSGAPCQFLATLEVSYSSVCPVIFLSSMALLSEHYGILACTAKVILYLHYCLSAALNITSCLLYTWNLQLKFKHKSQTNCVLHSF